MTEMSEKPKGSGPWYAGFVVALGVSVDTSWRYFGHRLGIQGPERVLLFSVVEVMLLAAAWSMRAGVRSNGHPGSARAVAWALCGFQGYMALELSGPAEGFARVVLGSGLALVALHQALGIEIKARTGVRSSTLARIGREMRERALSRLGLADDARDALQRTRERAAVRAAEIATSPRPSRRALRRAVLKAGPDMRALILDTRAALGSVDKLTEPVQDNPWATHVPVPSAPRPVRPSVRPTSGGPAIGWDVDKVVRLVREGRPAAEIMDACSVTSKTVQRVTRVVRAIASGQQDADIVRGDITAPYVQSIRKAMA